MKRFGLWHRLGYSLCNIATAIGQVPASLLLLYYLTEIVGVPAARAGLVLALPKAWDALVDPMFGGWIDRVSLRIGHRAPAILVSGGLLAGSLVLIFSLPQHGSSPAVVIVAILLLIVSSISQTGLGVSQYAMATEMTADPVDLTQLLSLAAILAQIASVVGLATVPMLIQWSGGSRAAYSKAAAEVAAVTGIAIFSFVFATRKVPIRSAVKEESSVSLWSAIRATRWNRSYYYLIGFVACQNVSIAVFTSMLPFANKYVLSGRAGTLSLLEGILGAAVVVGMALAPALLRRFDEVRSMAICNVISAGALCLLFAGSFGPLWLSCLAAVGVGLGWGAIGILVQTATLDAARLRPKDRIVVALGFYLGIMMAGIKIGNSIGGFVSGEFLSAVGFHPAAAVQATTTVMWLHGSHTILPLVFVLTSALFLSRVDLTPAGEPVDRDHGGE